MNVVVKPAAEVEARTLLIRRCRVDDERTMHHIINAAAEAYRGVIPGDCWHDPYMSEIELRQELDAGVVFTGAEMSGQLVGVMGIQPSRDVDLIRHAYALPEYQGLGIGGALLGHLVSLSRRRVLVGTWRDASWAIRFYERHGFTRIEDPALRADLFRMYWGITERQIETSVLLSL